MAGRFVGQIQLLEEERQCATSGDISGADSEKFLQISETLDPLVEHVLPSTFVGLSQDVSTD
jgi:hypothetical protein